MPASNPRYANGHRRRQLRARLLSAGAHCTWHECPWPTDWLGHDLAARLALYEPRYPVVDEIIPVSRGGDPLQRSNVRLLHRWCNGRRGNRPDPLVDQVRPPIVASPGWGPRPIR